MAPDSWIAVATVSTTRRERRTASVSISR
jgi:hypothetical protein